MSFLTCPSRLVSVAAILLIVAFSPQSTAQDRLGNLTAGQVWDRVMAVNRLWLLPTAGCRSYVATSVPVNLNVDVREKVDRVWVCGRNARWEMGIRKSAEHDFHTAVILVVRGEQEEYLKGARPNHFRGQPSNGVAHFVQGITWESSLHVIARHGLPENSKIISQKDIPGGRVLELQADVGREGGSCMGLGLNNEYLQFGHNTAPSEGVRIHIKTPEFIPIKEEYLESDETMEFGADYFEIGDQRAPKTVRYLSELDDGTAWVIEANFQRIGDHWLLKEAKNIHGGVTIAKMTVSEFSTGPIEPSLFAFTSP